MWWHALNRAFTKTKGMKIRGVKNPGTRNGPEKRKNQIAEAIWFVVEMRGIEPLTS